MLGAVATTLELRDRDWGDGGIEKSTHFTHVLASTDEENPRWPRSDYPVVLLHDYSKDLSGRTRIGTCIEDDHAHRGSVSSILLKGGYKFRERRAATGRRLLEPMLETTDPDTWLAHYGELEEHEAAYEAGQVMHVDPDEIHGLEEITHGTWTLVVRPTFRTFSPVFVTGRDGELAAKIIDDMPSHRQQLAEEIRQYQSETDSA